MSSEQRCVSYGLRFLYHTPVCAHFVSSCGTHAPLYSVNKSVSQSVSQRVVCDLSSSRELRLCWTKPRQFLLSMVLNTRLSVCLSSPSLAISAVPIVPSPTNIPSVCACFQGGDSLYGYQISGPWVKNSQVDPPGHKRRAQLATRYT